MLPELSVLLAILLGLSALAPGPYDLMTALLGTAGCCLVGVAGVRLALNRARNAEPEFQPLAIAGAGRVMRFWALAAWFAAISFFGWGSLIEDQVPRITWILRHIVLFVPALILFGTVWASHYELLEANPLLAARASSRWTAIKAGLRRNAIAFLPLIGILALIEGLWVAGELGVESLRVASQWLEHMPMITLGLFFGLTMLFLPFLPKLVCRMIKARSLEPGPLRTLLERGAKSIDLKYGDIKVWPTKHRMINAMVMGVTPRSRTIVMTDGIIDAMPKNELLAVFFHEAGHAKRRHLELYLLLFFCISTLFYLFHDQLVGLGFDTNLLGILFLAALWFGLLGWVSRRLEREADFYGADHALPELLDEPEDAPSSGASWTTEATIPRAPGATSMMGALDRIRRVAGKGISHRHGTVQSRIDAIAEYATNEETHRAHKTQRRTFKLVALSLAAITVALLITRLPREVRMAKAHIAAAEADALADQARVADGEERERLWQRAHTGWMTAATALRKEDAPVTSGQELRVTLRAADAGLRWSGDLETAKSQYLRCLEIMEVRTKQSGGNPTEGDLIRRFECWIDLGRIAARESNWAFAERYRKLASRALQYELTESGGYGRELRTYVGERMRLLNGTIELRQALVAPNEQAGAIEVARKELRSLEGTVDQAEHWEDLRIDAGLEANAVS